jgi:DNA repair exonuclease SbcCD ATPase subunit
VQIRSMQATFGKLENQTLTLKPGLNVLYAPNETGKSTWVAFLTDMLYGLSTKNRGAMADKNRYAPWSAQAMQGRLELTVGAEDYTVVRRTVRATAPMGDFSCTFSGTATDVPGIDKGNLGETVLGVPREVFERSALVRQLGLAVDQDAELERRIASLITTGEEDTSFTQTYNTLKAQLNSRKHNKTGQIPVLERQLEQLDDEIAALRALAEQEHICLEQLTAETQRHDTLNKEQALWQQAEQYRRAQTYRMAQEVVRRSEEKEALLAGMAADLPEADTLAQCAGQARALQQALPALDEARKTAAQKDADAQSAKAALSQISAPAVSASLIPFLPIGLGAGLILGGVLYFALHNPLLAGIGFALLTLTGLAVGVSKRSAAQKRAQAEYDEAVQTAQNAYNLAQQESLRADAAADGLAQSYHTQLSAVLDTVRRFQPAVADLSGALVALDTARAQRQALEEAKNATRTAQLHLSVLPEISAEEPKQAPTLPREAVEQQLQRTGENVRLLQSQLDTLRGQLRSGGNLAELESQRQQAEEALTAAQQEYEALTLAMEALSAANLTLQNRFSPQLGAKAAELFARLTGGKYQKVLLSRDFSLAAEEVDDPARRDIQLLSQGAADQLYLAVRLAICELVLPEDAAVPLILDDALLSFDETRCRAALELLAEEGKRRQILLFTCQKREGDYLSDRAAIQALS